MVLNATTDPTDRSMPPDRITKVMPTATMTKKALSISRFKNTCAEKNPLYDTEPNTDMAANSDTVAAKGMYLLANFMRGSQRQDAPPSHAPHGETPPTA